jgi:hypothetical protein
VRICSGLFGVRYWLCRCLRKHAAALCSRLPSLAFRHQSRIYLCAFYWTNLPAAPHPCSRAPPQWTMSCSLSDSDASDSITLTKCDVKGGQSGSGVMDKSTNQIRAIVSAENAIYNIFQQMTTARFNDALSWAGSEPRLSICRLHLSCIAHPATTNARTQCRRPARVCLCDRSVPVVID